MIKEKMSQAEESTWLSQQELANRLGVTQVMISRWENGEENFTVATLAKISEALDMELCNSLERKAV